MKPKIALTKAQQIEYWTQQYLQAKADGNNKLQSIYKSLIEKLGGTIRKF